MKKLSVLLLLLNILLFSNKSRAQNNTDDQKYIYKTGDYNGIGKWYMDREIAYVMGYEGIGWLERSQREKEENVSKLIQNMGIKSNDTIADIGAGSGYHVFRIAPIANKGMVYAVDIQTEMLMAIENIKETSKIKNIKTILSSEQSVYLAENSVDKILMVDVYHEFSFPIEMITSIKSALKPKGELFLVEYRAEDPNVPIKRIHKMS